MTNDGGKKKKDNQKGYIIYVISSIVFMYTQTFFYKKTFSIRNFERIDVVGLFRNPVVFVFSNLIVLYVKLINTLDRS